MPADCEDNYTIAPSDDSTVAIEIAKTGLHRKRKHLLFFENFNGEFFYSQREPERSRLQIVVDARSLVCRDAWLKRRQQRKVVEYARDGALAAGRHPEIRFSSRRISKKPLRGLLIEGDLSIRDMTRAVTLNMVVNTRTDSRLQLDADASVRLSDFGIRAPKRLLGLIGTRDEAVIHLLLWAERPGS